jgi:type III secretion protein S
MNTDELAMLVNGALFLVLKLALIPVGVATLAGVLVSLVQAATQIQDQTAPFLAKLCIVVLTLAVTGHWIGRELSIYTVMLFDYLPTA